jgi:hypothetical protein
MRNHCDVATSRSRWKAHARYLTQIAALAFAMVWCGWVLAADENLVANPGLEADRNADGIPDDWAFYPQAWTGAKGTIDWEKGAGHSGDYAARIELRNGVGCMSVGTAVLPVRPNTRYRVRGWLKARIEAGGAPCRAYFSVNGHTGGDFNRELGFTPFVQASSDWAEYTTQVTTGPDLDGLTIRANLFGAGQIWVDDVSCVVERPGEPPAATPPAQPDPGKAATPPAATEDQPGGLIRNGSAEDDLDGNHVPDHWTSNRPDAAVWSDEVAHSGTHSLKVTLKDGEGLTYWGQFGIPVVPGQKKYRVTFYVMTESFGQEYSVYIEGSKAGAAASGVAGTADQGAGKGTWHRKSFAFDMPHPGAADTIYIIFHLAKPGTVWYDDIAITEVPEEKEVIAPLALRLDRPLFRHTIFATETSPEVAGEVLANVPHPAGDCQVRVLDTANKAVLEATLPSAADQGRIAFRLAADSLPVGDFTLSARLPGAAGAVLEASLPLRRLGSAGAEIRFRDDRVMLLNAQPFFPLGLWQGGSYGEMAAAGFNLTMCESPSQPLASVFRAQMATLEKYGLKGFAQLTEDRTYDPAKDADRLRESITTGAQNLAGSTAFLGWVVDEPVWGGSPVAYAETLYRAIRETYPYALSWVNHAPRNSRRDLAAWNRFVDVTSCDIYPVPEPSTHSDLPNTTLSVVGDETVKQSQTVADGKPVWMVLQGFAWEDIGQAGKRPPTWAESRFMAYDAIINGAKGLWWWGTAYTPKPSPFWSGLLRVVGELRDLSAVLTAPDAALTLTVTGAAPEQIRWLAKHVDGKLFLLVENRLNQQTTVTLTGLGEQPDPLRVVFEERTVACAQGTLTDAFEPYAIHIYSNAESLPPPLVPPTAAALAYAKEAAKLEETVRRGLLSRTWEAQWIWHAERLDVPASSTFARKEFELATPAQEAWVQVTADDSFVLYVNGKVVGRGSCWQWGHAFEITAALKPGKNVIGVEGRNGVSKSGIILQGVIQTQAERVALKTDASWQVALTADEGWAAPGFAAAAWSAAHVIGAPPIAPWRSIGLYMGEPGNE